MAGAGALGLAGAWAKRGLLDSGAGARGSGRFLGPGTAAPSVEAACFGGGVAARPLAAIARLLFGGEASAASLN
eukprot:7733878-Pyramimonas_sp.AAC.1